MTQTAESVATKRSLLPQHLADLRKSGLSDATIKACGFHSLTHSGHVRLALRWKEYGGKLGPCLAIPFVDVNGKPTNYCRLKPDRPRKGKDGKPVKYESPKGAPNLPYFPPGTLAAINDPSTPLIITEGEKKVAKADQEGFHGIGLVGVYGWQKKRPRDATTGQASGPRELIDGLAAVRWEGRLIYLCYDSDVADNRDVLWAEWHLAQALCERGATVRVVRLSPGQPGPDGKPAKVGLDDYLVARGHRRSASCSTVRPSRHGPWSRFRQAVPTRRMRRPTTRTGWPGCSSPPQRWPAPTVLPP